MIAAIPKELSVKTGMSVLMISHDLNIAARYADRLLVLELPGRVHSIGTPFETITREMVREVYHVDCNVVEDSGSPHVILRDVIF